jgi:hypothetical protein
MRRDTEGENDVSKYLMQVKTKGVHMTTQISKATKNVPAQRSTEAENILGAAREDAGFEKLLKFKKGEFLIGEELVPLGTEYIAHVVGWTKCWIKFVDGEVADRKPYRVAHGEQPPEREDLGDLDRDTWPDGLDGKPADPGCSNTSSLLKICQAGRSWSLSRLQRAADALLPICAPRTRGEWPKSPTLVNPS